MLQRSLVALTALMALSACASLDANANQEQASHDQTHDRESGKTMPHHGPHVVTIQSNQNFQATLDAAKAGIEARGFRTFAVLDHAAGAASIDQVLRPTTLLIFGNPKGGTPLMQANQLMGLQLPLKILITEGEDGTVSITHADMAHTFKEYGIEDLTAPLGKISGALGAISAEAAGE